MTGAAQEPTDFYHGTNGLGSGNVVFDLGKFVDAERPVIKKLIIVQFPVRTTPELAEMVAKRLRDHAVRLDTEVQAVHTAALKRVREVMEDIEAMERNFKKAKTEEATPVEANIEEAAEGIQDP